MRTGPSGADVQSGEDDVGDATAPVAQQEAADSVVASTAFFAGLIGVLTVISYYWPDARLGRSAPVLLAATLVLTVLALRARLRPPSLWAAPHLVGLNALVLATATAAHVQLAADPFEVHFLLIVVCGIAARVSLTSWLVVGFAVCWVPVVVSLATDPDIQWLHGALVLGAATALGAFMHLARKRREEQIDSLHARLRRQAHHDWLTGLVNRHGLDLLGGMAVAGAHRLGHDVGVLFIDLDGLKAVNDERGHEAGDRFLCAVARQLDAGFRGADVVARIGGDEFLVLVTGPELDIGQVTKRGRAALRGVVQGASIGCAVSVGGGESLEVLIARADAAMYADKRAHQTAVQPAHG